MLSTRMLRGCNDETASMEFNLYAGLYRQIPMVAAAGAVVTVFAK